ncbi:hypothetical protein [Xylophilus sp. Leaf220]|uniref:hypothetical protein n=1 Tax=Xylophilus sp. Leaf220 TaxID=1735686 RepID=UPI0006F361D3|nr:hypothetical protein [Xylophilus sp. Leaf220]KQM68452.1 hypothetical protein ASE76_14250 [Xylophilus sp. Leaf220]
MQSNTAFHPHGFVRCATLSAAVVLALASGASHAQLVNYGEQLSTYKDNQTSGVRLIDATTPSVAARARVARALSQNTVVDQSALVQPDGTLKLPEDQKNVVIRTTYNDVTRAADGTLRVASPTIQGNVNGNVTLFVDGKGVQNITVLNNGR